MFIILFTRVTHEKNIQHFKSYSTLKSTMKSTIVQYNSQHPRADIEWTGKKSYWLEEGEEVGDCRAEVSKVVDGGRAAILLTPDVGVTGSGSLLHSSIATLLKFRSRNKISYTWKEGSWVKYLSFSWHRWHGSTGLYSEPCVPFYIWVLCLKIEQCLLK